MGVFLYSQHVLDLHPLVSPGDIYFIHMHTPLAVPAAMRCTPQDTVKTGGQNLLQVVGTRFERVALIPNFREVAHEMHVKEELMVLLNIMTGLVMVCVWKEEGRGGGGAI